ncbi:MAG: S8/S53 family peptidase [Bdellovibrionaceae bacterium]|nr:S8/S53 family peptidase [Pseudobdellovibrionaceae bacterium]
MKSVLAWMLLASISYFELANAESRTAEEQIRDLKEVIQSSAPFPKSPGEITEGTAGCLCEGVAAADTSVRPPANCDLKGARDDLKLLPKNWGLKATGADLLRDEPLLKSLKYENALGIVDSGLKLRGNPEAGSKLIGASPEEDAGVFHGTHVTGIASSEARGVNPHLATKVFPVPSNKWTDSTKTENLLNSLERAVNDKSVKVINLSWSFREQPKMVDLVRKATENGKWIVFAAGNENDVANIHTTGHEHFMKNPAFFKVGASSYFGSPSFFSNFGPDVTVYAPGSRIKSLDGAHNPNYFSTKSSVMMDGTSMAAPHFAAVLATLSNLSPELDATSMQQLIKSTAINRGTGQRPFYFLNAYLAFQTLANARECLKTSKPASQCLAESRQAVQKATTLPQVPMGAACNDWQLYYKALRKAYFLTQGHTEVVKAIAALFSDEIQPIAEKFLFLNRDSREVQNALLKDQTIPGIYRNEQVRGLDFLNGKLDLEKVLGGFDQSKYEAYGFKDYIDGKEPPKDKHPLELLLPIKENFGDFLKYCEADLKSEKSQGPCRGFVGNAPRQLKENLIEHLLKREPPTTNASILSGLNFGYDKAYDEKLRALYQKAIKICLQRSSCKKDDLERYFSSAFATKEQKDQLSRAILARARKGEFNEDLNPANRDGFINYWRTVSELGDVSKTEEEKARRLKEDLLKQETMQSFYLGNVLETSAKPTESDAATRLRYSSILAKEGYPTKDLREQIDQAVVKSMDFKIWAEEGDTLPRSIKRIANSDAANELVAYLSGPGNLDKLHKAYHDTSEFSSVVSRLLKSEKVDQKHKELLISAIKRAVKAKEVNNEIVFHNILKDNAEEPLVKMWLDEIKTPAGAKQYPEMAQSVLWQSVQLDRTTPAFEQLLQANKSKPSEWIFWANPKLTAENVTADRLVQSTFDRIAKNGKGSEDAKRAAWQWINNLDGKTMDQYGPTVVKALPSLLNAKSVPVDQLYQFVQKLVENEGGNRELMQKTIDTLRPFIRDERFLWRANADNIQTKEEVQKFESHGFPQERGSSILLKVYTLLNDSEEGRKILKVHPVWQELNAMAKEKMPVDIPTYSISSTPKSASVPEPMRAFYVGKVEEHLRTLTDDTQIMGQQRKFETAIVSSPELITPVIKRLSELREGSDAYRYLGALTIDFAKKSPQNARLIMNRLGSMNPTYYQASMFGPTKTRPLKEEIQRYLDYEN